MIGFKPKMFQSELSGRLQILMLARVVFISLLLGLSVFIQAKETETYFGHIQASHYLLIAIVYFLTVLYVIIFKYSDNLIRLAYVQLILDTFFVTAIMYTTGGMGSIFSFLYIIIIINGSLLLYRKGAFIVASCCSILFTVLVCLHYHNIIHPLGGQDVYGMGRRNPQILFLVFVNVTAFYLVAILSSYLSEQARKTSVELKAKQIDLDRLEVLNESIVNSITSGVIAVDGENRIVLINPAAEGMFGINAAEMSGRKVPQVVPSLVECMGDEQALFSESAWKRQPFRDLLHKKPDDSETYFRFSVSPLKLPAGIRKGHILVFQDMTEIRQIEKEMKKMEGLAMIGELAARIAHEIRNPLASISGSVQMLREGLEENDINIRLMEIVSREINRLNHLVNNFLQFARPKRTDFKEFDLNHLISESIDLFKNSIHLREGIKIHMEFQQPVRLESDPDQLKQVLWNLFLNASEAMPDGGILYVKTFVEADSVLQNIKKVKIVVQDTGDGFDSEILPHVFTPFLTTKKGGSGLGLAIVKGIVEGLAGEVSGDNRPEGGAEITISLPITRSGE